MKAQLCPKCNGIGYMSDPLGANTSAMCNLCNGAMIIYVPDDPIPPLVANLPVPICPKCNNPDGYCICTTGGRVGA